MANAKFCNMCGAAFPERQVGSVSLQITAAHGFNPPTRDLDICALCNPLLRMAKEALESQIALRPKDPLDEKLEQLQKGVDMLRKGGLAVKDGQIMFTDERPRYRSPESYREELKGGEERE